MLYYIFVVLYNSHSGKKQLRNQMKNFSCLKGFYGVSSIISI